MGQDGNDISELGAREVTTFEMNCHRCGVPVGMFEGYTWKRETVLIVILCPRCDRLVEKYATKDLRKRSGGSR